MYQQGYETEDETIDLGELFGVLIENRWLIIAITAVAFVIGLFKAYTAVPVYRADGLLQVEEQSAGFTTLDCHVDARRICSCKRRNRDIEVTLGAWRSC